MELLIPVVITIIFSALFSGLEIAFVTANKLKIEVDKNKDYLSARILSKFVKKPSRFLGALLVGNNIALVIYGIFIAKMLEMPLRQMLAGSPGEEAMLLILQTLISTLIIFIFGEFLPKTLFRINPNSILNFFAIPFNLFYILFYPVIAFFTGLSELILKYLLKVNITQPEHVFGIVDLDHFLSESSAVTQEESEDYQEIQMFQNARDLGNVKLRECMVPRNEIVALNQEESIDTLTGLFIESGHSKVLIYQDSIDNIIGYTHSYDLFKKPETIAEITMPVMIVPETMPASILLNMFMDERKSVALVVDEFGGTAGMLTIEDIIEEIFGEIDDEYDVEELSEKQIAEHSFIFSGHHEIDYLNQKYRLGLPESDDYETLAGLIIFNHESIPGVNEEIRVDDFVFTILSATENRIEEVLLKINPD